jgi:hypothetical protein
MRIVQIGPGFGTARMETKSFSTAIAFHVEKAEFVLP